MGWWLLWCWTWVAQAQTVGTVQGTVYDVDGLEVPGASVVLSGEGLVGGVRVTETDALGRYRVEALPPGRYALSATHPAMQSQVIQGIAVHAGRDTHQDVHLGWGHAEEIVVTAGSDLGDTSATVGQVLTPAFLARIGPRTGCGHGAVLLSRGVLDIHEVQVRPIPLPPAQLAVSLHAASPILDLEAGEGCMVAHEGRLRSRDVRFEVSGCLPCVVRARTRQGWSVVLWLVGEPPDGVWRCRASRAGARCR